MQYRKIQSEICRSSSSTSKEDFNLLCVSLTFPSCFRNCQQKHAYDKARLEGLTYKSKKPKCPNAMELLKNLTF